MTEVHEVTFDECVEEAARFNELGEHTSALECLLNAAEVASSDDQRSRLDVLITQTNEKIDAHRHRGVHEPETDDRPASASSTSSTPSSTPRTSPPQSHQQQGTNPQPNDGQVQRDGFLGMIHPQFRIPLLILAVAIVASLYFRLKHGKYLGSGDFTYQTGNTYFYFPMFSWLLFSLGMSAVVNLINYFANRPQ